MREAVRALKGCANLLEAVDLEVLKAEDVQHADVVEVILERVSSACTDEETQSNARHDSRAT
jgi:hypothetical protein